MDLLIQGIVMGVVLSFMVGPILFTIVQASLDRGPWAGILVGSGIWISDVMFITLIFTGFAYIENVIQMPDFTFFGGLIGGVILLAIGIGMVLNNQIEQRFEDIKKKKKKKKRQQAQTGIGLWLKGFLINTFNPFTVFFWMGIVSTGGLGYEEFTFMQVGKFFIGLMLTVIAFDVAKVLLAGRIRQRLNDNLILKLRKISGIALIAFGIALIIRVNF